MYSQREREIDLCDMRATKAKDEFAFARLVERYKKWAFRTALGLVFDPMTAADISQQAFISVWQHAQTWDESKGFRTWFYTMIRNACLNFERDNDKFADAEFDDTTENDVLSTMPDEAIDIEQKSALISRALATIDAESREILTLIDIRGHSYREAAELLAIPQGTVMSRIYYARKKLAKILAKHKEELL